MSARRNRNIRNPDGKYRIWRGRLAKCPESWGVWAILHRTDKKEGQAYYDWLVANGYKPTRPPFRYSSRFGFGYGYY